MTVIWEKEARTAVVNSMVKAGREGVHKVENRDWDDERKGEVKKLDSGCCFRTSQSLD